MPLWADVDWVAVLGALGAMLVAVIGALGAWYLKIIQARDKASERARAGQRKDRKDTIEELYEVLEVQRKDRAEDRELIHTLRGQLQQLHNDSVLCHHEREALRKWAEDAVAQLARQGITIRPAPEVRT